MTDNKPLKAEFQTNSVREVYRLRGNAFDTMLIETRGLEDLTMRLYIAFLNNPKQPLFLDSTATAKLLYTYSEHIDTGHISESKEYDIWELMKQGEEEFIKHDKEIDRKELDNLPKETNNNE